MVTLRGFEKLTNVDDALSIFLNALKPKSLQAESVLIVDALNRVVAENIAAPTDLPPFDRSAVDGYAIRAEDTFEAAQFKPKAFRLTQKHIVEKGQARQIWTGNPVPKGANSVVMLEHAQAVRNFIDVVAPITPGENTSKKGEDIKKGTIAVGAGTKLKAQHLGLLAALGLTEVDVARKPRVGILSIGNELVELGKRPGPDQIVNSNRFVIWGLCEESGAEPEYLGIVRDNEREIHEKIAEGLAKTDIIITTGGTSVGLADLVPIVVSRLGKPGIVVHGVAMRPGMPTALGILKGKPVFMLSGNPVAAAVGFEVFVRPIILRMVGISCEPRPWIAARLTRRVAGALGRRVYLRAKAVEQKGELYAEPILAKGSGLLSSLTKANGYVIIPEDREGLEEGETVTVHLFSPIVAKEQ